MIINEAFGAWTTPFFSCDLALSKDQLDAIDQLVQRQAHSQMHAIGSSVAQVSKHNLIESDFNFLQQFAEKPYIKLLIDRLIAQLTLAIAEVHGTSTLLVSPKITESWFHLTEKGGYHDVHSHPNASWCGIFCVATDIDDPGVNRFYDPRVLADQYQDQANQYLAEEGVWDFCLQPNQCLFFPAYLKHAALPYAGNKNRIVIAFNTQSN